MNKRQAFALLRCYLREYGGNFYFHSQFVKDLGDILSQNVSGHEKRLFQLLIKQLEYVKNMGVRVNEADSNEILSHTQTGRIYYSLHLTDKVLNIRLLMTFFGENEPVFLAAFFERAGKRKSDYSKWIPIMERRRKQMEE